MKLWQEVNNFKIGDRVFGLIGGGAYAEQITLNAECVSKMPDFLNFVEAAAIPEVYITAYDALFTQLAFIFGRKTFNQCYR